MHDDGRHLGWFTQGSGGCVFCGLIGEAVRLMGEWVGSMPASPRLFACSLASLPGGRESSSKRLTQLLGCGGLGRDLRRWLEDTRDPAGCLLVVSSA